MPISSREVNEDVVVGKVRKTLLTRCGSGGLKAIVSQFRTMDANNDGTLDPTEFENGLRRYGVQLTPFEVKYLVMAFDRDKDGKVTLDEFVRALRGSLNPRRLAVVKKAFDKFDRDDSNTITVEDLAGKFIAADHPDVVAGRRSEAQVLGDFLKVFDSETNPDGTVTQNEFICYYAGVSSNIDSDDYFEAMVIRTWQLDDSRAPRLANTTSENNPLAITSARNASELYSTNTTTIMNSRDYDTSHIRRPRQDNAPAIPQKRSVPLVSSYRAQFPHYGEEERKVAKALSNVVDEVTFSPTGNPVLDRVRKKFIERGGREGFTGLSRTFRIADRNRNGKIEPQELQRVVKVYGVPLSAMEMDTIIKNFDTDKDGSINLTEFLRGVRGPMTSLQRQAIVKRAFERLEKDGDGVVTLRDIAAAYDVDKHPDVVEGKADPDAVLRQFVEDWDRNADGVISWEEFLEYYSNISAGIDSDQYFELMVRNAWHISGGVGVAANTTCRRVLVTFSNGDQRVEEITDDLGMRKDDIPAMRANLEKRGLTGIVKIELTGAV
eukprot:PhM_4_TR838/c0_g1_i1/m.59536